MVSERQIETELPKDLSVAQKATKIMADSERVVNKGINEFLEDYTKYFNIPADSPQIIWANPGGVALGDRDHRVRLSTDPDLLRGAVADRLKSVLGLSADSQEKLQASNLNAQQTEPGFWRLGDLVHHSQANHLDIVLEQGLLCSELHGASSKVDATPLAADLTQINDRVEPVDGSTKAHQREYAVMFGHHQQDILLRFRRQVGSTDYGEEGHGGYDSSPAHRKIFVGIPSTEIAAIQVVGDNVDTEQLIKTIEKNGQYIPIFNQADELVFTSAEFELVTGIELGGQESQDSDKLELNRSKDQLVRMAERLKSLYDSHSVSSDTGFNSAFVVSDRRTLAFNNEPQRLSVQLEDDKQLHIRETQTGDSDMFISQLDAEARHVTTADLPQLRSQLAKEFAVVRSRHLVEKAYRDAEAAVEYDDVT